MTDILLALCLAAAFALGCLPMKRLDRFLEQNRRTIEEQELDAFEDAIADADGERLPRPRAGRLSLPAGLRGNNLYPLRHRS